MNSEACLKGASTVSGSLLTVAGKCDYNYKMKHIRLPGTRNLGSRRQWRFFKETGGNITITFLFRRCH
jgi:hypothetical protein